MSETDEQLMAKAAEAGRAFRDLKERAAESEILRGLVEMLCARIEWAREDAVYTAPEDGERRARHWRVLHDSAADARDTLARLSVEGEKQR